MPSFVEPHRPAELLARLAQITKMITLAGSNQFLSIGQLKVCVEA